MTRTPKGRMRALRLRGCRLLAKAIGGSGNRLVPIQYMTGMARIINDAVLLGREIEREATREGRTV
jgi:hypothetical protein